MAITVPIHMQYFETQLSKAVGDCFPDHQTLVQYWGSNDGEHKWRVVVQGSVKDLTQDQAALAVGGRREDFRKLFDY